MSETTSRMLNKLPPRGLAKIFPPRYHAVELLEEPGVYLCPARGEEVWTAAQLEAWAKSIGAEVALVAWVRDSQDQLELPMADAQPDL